MMWPGLGKDEVGADSLDDVLRVAPFWLRTESYFGDEAREFATDHFGRDQVSLGGFRTSSRRTSRMSPPAVTAPA